MGNELQTSRRESPTASSTPQATSPKFPLARQQTHEMNCLTVNSPAPVKGTVLIVGFDSITAEIICLTLQRQGFCVQQAGNQETALNLADRFSPQLVLQNLDVPDLDVWNLVSKFRLLPRRTRLPVLALSGDPSQLQRVRISEAGFTGFLCKPFLPSHLVHTVCFYLKANDPSLSTHGPQTPLHQTWARVRMGGRLKRRRFSPASARGQRILVIEDNPFQQALLATSLTELGLEVTTAEDGLEALRLARVWPPDAFVTDALVPGLDGFELCLVIHQDPRIAHIPVILTSAGPLGEVDYYLARKVGCNALVQRQADSAEVIEALLACLRQDLMRLPVIDGAPIHFAAYGKAGVDWEKPV